MTTRMALLNTPVIAKLASTVGLVLLATTGRKSTINSTPVVRAAEFTARGMSEGWICGVAKGAACGQMLQNTLAMDMNFTTIVRSLERQGVEQFQTAPPPKDATNASLKGGWHLVFFNPSRREFPRLYRRRDESPEVFS